MSLEYLIKEWKLIKLEIVDARSDERRSRLLRYAKSIFETALALYGVDLYSEYGGLQTTET